MAATLNPFVQEIEDRKKREISSLTTSLEERKNQIQRMKEDSIIDIKEKYANEAQIKSQRESARIKESARLQAKKILFDAINSNMEETFAILKTELKNYTKKSDYKKTIEKMITFAKKKLDAEIVVSCRNEDTELVKGLKVTTTNAIPTMGGVLVSDKSGNREIDLTFEELLRTKEDEIKNYLLDKTA